MKIRKVISIIGLVIAASFAVLVVAIGSLAYIGSGTDDSSEAYVRQVLPQIFADWSTDDLIQHAAPDMVDALHRDLSEFHATWQQLSQLGSIQSIDDVQGESHRRVYFGTAKNENSLTAGYRVKATFEQSSALVKVRLVWLNDQWRLLFVNITPNELHPVSSHAEPMGDGLDQI